MLSLATAGIVCGMTLPCMAGVGIYITTPPPPTVVITAPALVPPPVTVVVAPDDYVWDGTEYVGVVGGQYYYLGPGSTWVVMDPVRLHRYQLYVHDHPDWHSHMIHNVKYHNMPHGHPAPAPMHDKDGHSQPDRDYDHHGPPQ